MSPEELGAALHRIYCVENAPMHSHPLHSADRILAAIPTGLAERDGLDVERRLQWLESAARFHNEQLRSICACPKTVDGPRTATNPACLIHRSDLAARLTTTPGATPSPGSGEGTE